MTVRDLPPDRPEHWETVPKMRGETFSRYQVSDKGRFRRDDGRTIAVRPQNRGYMQADLTADAGKRVTVSAHRAVLLAFAPPPKPREETRHGIYGPQVNWYPENLRWGTKAENAADKPVNGGGEPSFPCRNAPTCGNMVMNEGRRCTRCVRVAAIGIANRLRAGMSLEEATTQAGYQSAEWAWKLARDFGGWEMTLSDTRRQRPTVTQRARITLRNRRVNGWGDAA